MLYKALTSKIIEAFYKVNDSLGYGFLEKVYENAMYIELSKRGFDVKRQKNIKVFYKGYIVGDYYADLIINNRIIVELKAAKTLSEEHEAQLLNYLRSTKIEVGLLLNFGKKAEFKRKIYTNKPRLKSI